MSQSVFPHEILIGVILGFFNQRTFQILYHANMFCESLVCSIPQTFWPLIWKDPNAGKDWSREEKEMTEDEMVGWHHQLNGHKFQ